MIGRGDRARREPLPLAVGARVVIRFPTKADIDDLTAVRIASRSFLERWEPIPTDGLDAWDRAWAVRVVQQADAFDRQRHLVCARADGAGLDDDGRAIAARHGGIVGMVSLSQIFRGPFRNAVMGYWVSADAAGRGFATEALRLVLGRAFGVLDLHRVEANIMPTNAASLALAKRVGFREEGYSPKYLQIAGEWADHTRWAMTAEDWAGIDTDATKRA